MRIMTPALSLIASMAVATSLTPARLNAQAAHTPPAHAETHSGADASSRSGIKNVFWQPNQLQQGSPAFFTVELDHPARRVTATWIHKTIPFFKPQPPAGVSRSAATKSAGKSSAGKSGNPNVWYALTGADLETQPGSYDLVVTAVLTNGHVVKTTKSVEVAQADFKTGEVSVPENFVQPDEASKKQIVADDALKARAFAHDSPQPLWSGNFLKPVDAPSTPSFGESRVLNEERTSTHRGTDFPVKEGSPVIAANSGTVVLAQEMFYEGNCVIIDHGQRLFTVYMHLSKMDVATGDRLAKGARIGLSGATGRVTGPHMHFGLRSNGAYLDPVQLLSLTLPKTGAQITTLKHPARRRATAR